MKISIVVPCYNEEMNILRLVEAFDIVERELKNEFELLLVDNGSTDDTRSNIIETVKTRPWMRLIIVEKKLGYGYGIKNGLEQTTGDFLGWIHADLQTPARSILDAEKLMEKYAFSTNYFYKGERKNRSLLDCIFTKGMAIYESLYLGIKLNDINGQPCIISREMFEYFQYLPDDFSIDLFIILLKEMDIQKNNLM